MTDYIRGGDAKFDAKLENFVTCASRNLANLILVQGDIDPIVTAQTPWNTAYTAHVAAPNLLAHVEPLRQDITISAKADSLLPSPAGASRPSPDRSALAGADHQASIGGGGRGNRLPDCPGNRDVSR